MPRPWVPKPDAGAALARCVVATHAQKARSGAASAASRRFYPLSERVDLLAIATWRLFRSEHPSPWPRDQIFTLPPQPPDPARRHRGPRAVPSLMASSEPDQSDDLPDPASAYPATIIVDGNVYDVLPAGRPVHVKGPWPRAGARWLNGRTRPRRSSQRVARRPSRSSGCVLHGQSRPDGRSCAIWSCLHPRAGAAAEEAQCRRRHDHADRLARRLTPSARAERQGPALSRERGADAARSGEQEGQERQHILPGARQCPC